MIIEGKLSITFDPELNNAGQRPISILFTNKDGRSLEIMGVRYKNGHVLDSVAISQRGWAVYHTKFSPELQSDIIALAEGKRSTTEDSKYQDEITERMNKRAKEALGG